MGTRRRKQCKSLQVAIGCFREKVYYTLSESRALSSPIGNRYSGRSRGLSQMRQVVPYRRSLFRRSAMNCLSPYASLFTSCVNCIRSLRLPLAATFAKLLQALSRRRQLRSEAPVTSTVSQFAITHPSTQNPLVVLPFSVILCKILSPEQNPMPFPHQT